MTVRNDFMTRIMSHSNASVVDGNYETSFLLANLTDVVDSCSKVFPRDTPASAFKDLLIGRLDFEKDYYSEETILIVSQIVEGL